MPIKYYYHVWTHLVVEGENDKWEDIMRDFRSDNIMNSRNDAFQYYDHIVNGLKSQLFSDRVKMNMSQLKIESVSFTTIIGLINENYEPGEDFLIPIKDSDGYEDCKQGILLDKIISLSN